MYIKMSKIVFEYPHLENAQDLLETIRKHYNEFDWNWADADRAKNRRALQKVLNESNIRSWFQDVVRLFEFKMEDWNVTCSFYYYEERMSTFVDLYPDWIEQVFDFSGPMDVLQILDWAAERAEEMKMFYQIKTA